MTQDAPNSNEQALASFRRQIDALDDKIIALLIERIGIVGQVGEFKRDKYPGKCPIRAGREADMVRRIIKEFQDTKVNPAAAAAVWRILIGSSTCVEAPLSLSLYAPSGDDTFYWLAREYFGPTLPVTRQPHVKRVIGDVIDGKASVGIVPLLQNNELENWWTTLMPQDDNTPKIFAHVPFVRTEDGHAPAALAIARLKPEATGSDVSFIVLDADHNVSQHRLQTAFTQAKLPARWLGITSPSPSTRRHLIELGGFIAANDDLKTFLADLGPSVLNTYYLGTYATPIVLKSNQPAVTAYASSPAQKTLA